ncbi:hypothetical protein OG21DRAFT_1273638 [Imleria badia]|nr:hypothetical protein OG21DRAFT_1273638 [Imleria badia]
MAATILVSPTLCKRRRMRWRISLPIWCRRLCACRFAMPTIAGALSPPTITNRLTRNTCPAKRTCILLLEKGKVN